MVLAWGLNFSVIKIAYREVSPPSVGLFRFLCMLPILALWCVFAKQSLRFPRGRALSLLFAGFVGSGAYMVLFLEGMRTAPAAHAAIALATAPIMTAALSVLAKQDRGSWQLAVGSVIAFTGVALSVSDVGGKGKGSLVGVLLIVGAAFLWSCSIILYRKLVTDMAPVRALTLSFPGAALALIPYGWHEMTTTNWTALSWMAWAALAYLVVFAGVGAFAAYYKGVADVGPAATSMTQYFVTPIAAISSALILKESVHWNEIVGLAIVILGVALTSSRRSLPEEHVSPDSDEKNGEGLSHDHLVESDGNARPEISAGNKP